METAHEQQEEYAGAAEIAAESGPLPVEVTLRGHFEPLDGRFHWYGRIAADEALDQAHRSGSTVTLRTPYGEAAGRLSDKDPWGRFRIAGLGTPPF
ncbi:DUF4873 domain-containing protein [Marmoricola sp. RAF53]|uniref:DUF4873 domain-containing protein n=1 Tax=Marmoricola sp. RAF53 TaxID=3233059 RepID=UPI003F95893A